MTSLPIRILASAIALVLVLAAAAEAKPRKQGKHAASTSVTVHPQYRGTNLFPAGPVYYGNEYLGDDPDPFIRQQLLRDLTAHFGGAF